MTRKLLVLALLAITCLSVSAQSFGLIRIAVAPLREEPSHAAEMGSQLVLGTPVKLAGIAGGEFWEVTAPDGYHGYIHQSSIEPLTDEAATRWKSADRVIVTADIAWLKNMDGTPAGYAPFGSVLTPADWNKLNIEPEGAKAGYVLLELPDGKLAEGNVYDFAIFSDFAGKTLIVRQLRVFAMRV